MSCTVCHSTKIPDSAQSRFVVKNGLVVVRTIFGSSTIPLAVPYNSLLLKPEREENRLLVRDASANNTASHKINDLAIMTTTTTHSDNQAKNSSSKSQHGNDDKKDELIQQREADVRIKGVVGAHALDAETPTDMERGQTLGSLDAADVPIPTTLQRDVPMPGAFHRAGPGASETLGNSISVGGMSHDAPSTSPPPATEGILISARLVIEEINDRDEFDDEEAQVKAVAPPPMPVRAVASEDFELEKARNTTFWTRRNMIVAFVVALVVVGLIIGLVVMATNSNKDPPIIVIEEEGNSADNSDTSSADDDVLD